MSIQTLTFNTSTKVVTLVDSDGNTIFTCTNVPTVSVKEAGYYEVFYKQDEKSASIPILRVPISTTNMFIEKDSDE